MPDRYLEVGSGLCLIVGQSTLVSSVDNRFIPTLSVALLRDPDAPTGRGRGATPETAPRRHTARVRATETSCTVAHHTITQVTTVNARTLVTTQLGQKQTALINEELTYCAPVIRNRYGRFCVCTARRTAVASPVVVSRRACCASGSWPCARARGLRLRPRNTHTRHRSPAHRLLRMYSRMRTSRRVVARRDCELTHPLRGRCPSRLPDSRRRHGCP